MWRTYFMRALRHFPNGLDHQLRFIEMYPMAALGGDEVLAIERAARDGFPLGQLRGSGIGCRNDGDWNVNRQLGALGRLGRAGGQRFEVIRHSQKAFWLAPMRLHDRPSFRRHFLNLTNQARYGRFPAPAAGEPGYQLRNELETTGEGRQAKANHAESRKPRTTPRKHRAAP